MRKYLMILFFTLLLVGCSNPTEKKNYKIELNGKSIMILEKGVAFDDPGAQIIDNNGTKLDAEIKSNCDVDINVVGRYKCTYTSQKTSNFVTRDIYIIDDIKSTITSDTKTMSLLEEDYNDAPNIHLKEAIEQNGSIYSVGTLSFNAYDTNEDMRWLLVKLNAEGDVMWSLRSTHHYKDSAFNSIVPYKNNEEFIVVGHEEFIPTLYKIIKDVDDEKVYNYITKPLDTAFLHHGKGELKSVTKTSDGNYIAVGYDERDISSGDYSKSLIIKFDENLNIIWKITPNYSTGDDVLNHVLEMSNGEFIAVGKIDNKSFMIKFDKYGNILKAISNPFYYEINDIIETEDGNLVVVGEGSSTAYILSMTKDGEVLWSDIYIDLFSKGYYNSIYQLENGNYVVAGVVHQSDEELYQTTTSSSGIYAIYNQEGQLLGRNIYHKVNKNVLTDVVESNNGNILAIGYNGNCSSEGYGVCGLNEKLIIINIPLQETIFFDGSTYQTIVKDSSQLDYKSELKAIYSDSKTYQEIDFKLIGDYDLSTPFVYHVYFEAEYGNVYIKIKGVIEVTAE